MSLFGKIGKGISHFAGQVGHVATDVGHGVGDALDNKYVKGALAAGLTATGVGAPLAIGLMAGEGALGGALKRGGGLHDSLGGAASGAAQGGLMAAGGAFGHAPIGIGGAIKNYGENAAKNAITGKVADATHIPVPIVNAAANVIPGVGGVGGGPGGPGPKTSPTFPGSTPGRTSSPNPDQSQMGDYGDEAWTGDVDPNDATANPTPSVAQTGSTQTPGAADTGKHWWDYLGDAVKGAGNAAPWLIGGAQVANAALLQNAASTHMHNALTGFQNEWDTNAPLRASARASMLNPRNVDPNTFFNQPGGGPSIYHQPIPITRP